MKKSNNGRVLPLAAGLDRQTLPKCPTGISGLDEITLGGLPRGRPTLVCGSAGCGKTLFSMEFLVRGATEFNEPGVFMSFEEQGHEIAANVASLGFDVPGLVDQGLLSIDHVQVERGEIEETGEYDLEGLFIRLGYAIDSIGAKRVVLDTIESLFSGLSNTAILRSEIRRLFRYLKDKGVTAVITGERGDGQLTRQGLEEYVSDCVILLDHRLHDQISTRRLRIVKYRGSLHGTNEYPFLIDKDGISVVPITSLGLSHRISDERLQTGIAELDEMFQGGVFRGSSVLITGTAGTGKSSLAAHFAHASCKRNERCLYFAFEESEPQIIRNMRSIGIDLAPHVKSGLLQIHSSRPSAFGLEMHLGLMHKAIEEQKPALVIVDPITNLTDAGTEREVNAMVVRLVDYLKSHQITGVFTSLTASGDLNVVETSNVGISSLMDSWMLVRQLESGGERVRGLYVLKSRGTAHSNQVREFQLSNRGVRLVDVYVGPNGILTGSARAAQETRDREELTLRRQEAERRRRAIEHRRQALEGQIAALQAQFRAEAEALDMDLAQEAEREDESRKNRLNLAEQRSTVSADRQTRTPRARKDGRK